MQNEKKEKRTIREGRNIPSKEFENDCESLTNLKIM
jgi:hypothetical protein